MIPKHITKLTAKEYLKYLKTGGLPVKKRNKFGAEKKLYNGRKYDSIGEAEYSAELDLRKKAGEFTKIEYQYKITLEHEGVKICDYYIDFKTLDKNGLVEYREFKGNETPAWKLKWKLTKAKMKEVNPDGVLVLIKKKKRRFVEVERFSLKCE